MQKPYKIQDIDPIVLIIGETSWHHNTDLPAKNEQNLPHSCRAIVIWNLSQSHASS